MVESYDIHHAKILIVDDLETNILLLDRILRGSGYVCVESTTMPHEVCNLHCKNRYDLILLDLQMPGTDGFQVMANLKELESDSYLPVIVVTSQPSHNVRALIAGAIDFISKPFEIADVLVRVHNMLAVRLQQKEAKSHIQVLEQRVLGFRRTNYNPTTKSG